MSCMLVVCFALLVFFKPSELAFYFTKAMLYIEKLKQVLLYSNSVENIENTDGELIYQDLIDEINNPKSLQQLDVPLYHDYSSDISYSQQNHIRQMLDNYTDELSHMNKAYSNQMSLFEMK